MFFSKKQIIRMKLYLKYKMSKKNKKIYEVSKEQKKIIVALAANYGNLGDVAITYAQTKFLEDKFPGYRIIDFPITETFENLKSIKAICTSQDIITIVGGGNIGDMYDDIEYSRQFIVKNFPENKIISFPQSIDFTNTPEGIKAFKKASNIYRENQNMSLIAREERSYKILKNISYNKVLLTPDIVLSLNLINPKLKRKGITICMRKDEEKLLSEMQEKELIEISREFENVSFRDTHISQNKMSIDERERELKKLWSDFKKSKLVLTDRLHGMVFCAITGTPCIAFNNTNKKIAGVYHAWLKKYNYIIVLDEFNPTEIRKSAKNLLSLKDEDINHHVFDEEFREITKLIYN